MADDKKNDRQQVMKASDVNLPEESIERIILKKYLTDRTFTTFISENADPECFGNPVIRRGMEVAFAYNSKGYKTPLDSNLLSEIMAASGFSEESKLLPSYANIDTTNIDDEFARDVSRKYIQGKKLFNLVFANSAQMMKAKNFAPVIDGIQKIAAMDFDTDLGFNYLANVEEHVEYLTNPEFKMSTGYSHLDYLMSGGLPVSGKCLLVFMAQAGLGKSMMMHNMASRMVRNGKKVLIISLEMTEQVYACRFSANFTECNINNLNLEGNIAKIISVRDEISSEHPEAGLIIKEFPPSSLRPMALANYIDKLILHGWKPDVVFVDYLNIMIPNSVEKGDNSYVKVGEACKELRALSYRFEIPFITATQTNRDGFGATDIDMSNISESMGTAHHSDGIFGLVSEGLESGLIDLIALKNRFGGKVGSRIKFAFNSNNLTLTEVETMSEEEREAADRAAQEIADMDVNG